MFGANPSNAFIIPSTVNVSAVWSVIWSLWNTPAETRIKSREISAQMRNWVTSLTWRRSSTSAHSCLQLPFFVPPLLSLTRHSSPTSPVARSSDFVFLTNDFQPTRGCFCWLCSLFWTQWCWSQLLLVLGEHNGQFFLLSWWSFCLSLLFSRSAS